MAEVRVLMAASMMWQVKRAAKRFVAMSAESPPIDR